MRTQPWIAAGIAAVVAGCDATGPRALDARLDAVSVAAGPHNVLSAVVRGRGLGDSARVRFQLAAAAGPLDSMTPAFAFEDDSVRVPVLGLLPQSAYSLRLVVYGGPDTVSSPVQNHLTGSLPADLPAYTAGGSAPLPGFVVFSAGQFGIVIDNTGRVVWYRRFLPGGPSLNFMAQPSGQYVGRPGNNFMVVDALGDSVRSIECANDRPLRFHDLIIDPDGSSWLMCDETRTVDLTAWAGSATAQVTGTTVQRLGPSGALLFEWTPFDHFAMDDGGGAVLASPVVNWTHGNSIDRDTDGNILISFRSLSEITKFNAQTGIVMWRMGGLRNQFTFSGSPEPGFSRQHNVRVVGPGRFMIVDNVGGANSRYERYQVDANALTATIEQSYGSSPGVQTLIGGSVQQSGANRWLVSFGTTGRVEEFDENGTMLWHIEGNPGYVFRAQRITSLYRPGVASAR